MSEPKPHTWAELLEKDAEMRAYAYATGNNTVSYADTADAAAFSSGAQLPNERLLKLIEAIEHWNIKGLAMHKALAELKTELESK